MRKPGQRTTLMDLSRHGHIVNVPDKGVEPVDAITGYGHGEGLSAADGIEFALDIDESGAKS